MNKNSTKLLVALFFSSIISLKAQQTIVYDQHNHEQIDAFNLPLEFDKDSLKGFNEVAAWQQAKMGTDQVWRQERLVAVLKRNYIDFKYGFLKSAPTPVVQGPCTNPDFETGNISGWVASQSPNNNSQTMLPWANATTAQATIVTPGNDPNIGALLTRVPPGGGNFACRIGPTGSGSGGTSYRMTQSFTVTAANSAFVYKYAVMLNNSSPHSCTQQPFFNVSFKDCANNPIPCGQYNVAAVGSGCSTGADPSFVTSGSWAYKQWTTNAFDLTPYIGQCVNLEFTVGGCIVSQAGHGAYAYIDASCQPFTLNLNGDDIPVGQTNNSFCGAAITNTLCAPPGFSYSWTGPGVTGQTGQCVNTSSNGTYSVTLGVPGTSCPFSPVLYSTFNSVPNPTLTASLTQPVCVLPAGTATLNVAGGTGPYTYSWTPAAPSNSVNTNLPAGTSYTASVTDDNGCIGSTTFSIDPYPPAPSYTLDVSPSYSLSCASPSTTITFAPTNTNTSSQWDGPSGTITGTNVVVTSPGVYTYTTINTVSTCSLTGSINITGSVNLPVLTSTLTQPNCASPVGSATVSVANGTAPYTYSWSPTVSAPADTTNSNLPPGTSYTVSVTDDIGCTAFTVFSIDPFAGSPLYTLSNNPSLLITCGSPSTTLTFAPTNTNTSTSWSGPSGVISGTTTVVTATAAGTYSYVALNTLSTCSVVGTVVVTTDTILPSATYTVGCTTNTINLAAASTSGIQLDWYSPLAPSLSIGNPASSTAIGIYTLTASNSTNGCVQTYTTPTSIPTISIVSSPTTNILTCITTTVNATATSDPGNTFAWNNGTSTVTTNPLPISANGTYTAIATNSIGCSSQSVITVSTNTAVNVSITPSSNLITCATGSVSLSASSSVGGSYTYSWTPSVTTTTGTPYVVTSAGDYTVVALNSVNGCTATATKVIGAETIDASFIADTYQGQMPLPVTFTNTSVVLNTNPAGTNYTWSFGDGNGTASNDTTVNHLYNSQGNFPVILTAINGFCSDTAVRYIKVDLISVFEVPNVFTPNGDGKNDVFTFNAINMGEITLTIFDRWGLKMFEATDTGNVKWDGKNKGGSTVTDGTYFYIIKATGLDDVKYDLKGSVNVFQ